MKKDSILFQLNDLQRYYITRAEVVKAIDGITLSISEGEFLAILGPSGSGKSTLLNLLSGLDKPTGGSIFFRNFDYSKLTDSKLCDLRRYEIGIVFQFYNMHPSLSAIENIEYPMMIANIPAKKRHERSEKLIRQVGLYDKRDNSPAELSGGEKQRVGIARALTNDPKVIIADEPSGDLDSENAVKILKLLADIHQDQGKTIIMVTHDESLLTENMRVIYIEDGNVAIAQKGVHNEQKGFQTSMTEEFS